MGNILKYNQYCLLIYSHVYNTDMQLIELKIEWFTPRIQGYNMIDHQLVAFNLSITFKVQI